MITIDQLLESVDLDFEPRFVTKDEDGSIWIWNAKPVKIVNWCLKNGTSKLFRGRFISNRLKLSEFEDKNSQECIYEVPRKTTGKIEKIEVGYNNSLKAKDWQDIAHTVANKINELIVAVNKHADIIQQIGQWGNSKGECLWCETLTKFETNELKGAK